MDRWDSITNYCCRSCRFFVPKEKESESPNPIGRCRRHSPTLDGYPVVFARTDWCGDLKLGTNPDKANAEEV